MQNHTQEQLTQYVEQIEKLEAEKGDIAALISDKYREIAGSGFDVKILRKIIALRKKSADEIEEERSVLDVYLHALGMIPPDAS